MIDEVQRPCIDQEIILHRRLPRHLDGSAYEAPTASNRKRQDVSLKRDAERRRRCHSQASGVVVNRHNRSAEEIVADNPVGPAPGVRSLAGNRRKAQIDVFDLHARHRERDIGNNIHCGHPCAHTGNGPL